MTHNSNLKRQVRARMAETGEKYTTALAAIARLRNLEHGGKKEDDNIPYNHECSLSREKKS